MLAVFFTPSAFAAPWWWAQFTLGDGFNTGNSQFERWNAFAAAQATDATDSVYLCSFTWGSADIGTINGINGANSAGLNSVSAAGGKPTVIIGDGDGGANWTNAKTLADANVTEVNEPAGGDIMHLKDLYVANKGYMVSSANHTAGGYNSQNNSAIWFKASALPLMMKKAEQQMYEMSQGTFHDASAYGTTNFFSPYGDTVELRYSPDDNDGTTGAGTGTIIGRLRQLAQGADESIFYMSDAWSSGAGQSLLAGDINANNAARVCGVGGAGFDWDAATRTGFEADHTHRNDAGNFNHLHSKIFIFDMEVVAMGSANMTASATYSVAGNDEVYVIVHDFRLARRYMTHYHKCMSDATADPSADGYDNTSPNGATALVITPTDTAFYASWTASATTDVSRYYLFIDTAALTQAKIGNFTDDDADGYIDEDPRGDYDGFVSGVTAGGGATAADDDADGAVDEDLWMAPEAMVKGRASTSGAIRTWNVGDTLQAGVNYYFAVVSVDTQGNEGTIATAGPVKLGSLFDTRIIVQPNYSVADSTIRRGCTQVVAAQLFIRGDTSTSQDTLTVFAVKNAGNADSGDVLVWLWRDEDSNARVGAADTKLAQLNYSNQTGRFQTTFAKTDTRVRLGTAGKTFMVVIDITDTAGVGDTFRVQIDAKTCSSPRRDSGPTASALCTGTITITFIDTTPPAPSNLTSPSDKHETRNTSVMFRWTNALDDSSPPSTYRVQVDTAGTFAATVYDSSWMLETYVTVALRANDTYFWRVICRDTLGNTVNSVETWTVIVDTRPPSTPSLTAPSTPLDTFATSILFSWTAASDTGVGVAGYRLQIDTRGLFTTLLVDSFTPLTFCTRTLAVNDTYYWRIVTADDAGNTVATTSRIIRIDTAGPAIGSLSRPADGCDTNLTSIIFSWTAATDSISGMRLYRLQVDTSVAFTAPIIDSTTTLLTATRTLAANDTYYWRIVAEDTLGNTTASSYRRVRVDTTTPPGAVLIVKSGDTFTSIVPLTWVEVADSISGLHHYVVQVDTAGTFLTLKDSQSHLAGDTAHNFTLPVSDTYYWRVLSYDSAGNMSISTPAFDTFVSSISDTIPPDSFSLSSPSDLVETSSRTITLRWGNAIDSASNPVRYHVQATTGADFSAPYFDTTGLIETWVTAVFAANDTTTWRVIAVDNSGNTVAALSTRRAVVDTYGPSTGSLLSPSASLDTRSTAFTFSWIAASDTITGVSGYRLQVDTSGAFTPPSIDSFTSFTSCPRTLAANDTYYWRIVAVDDAGNTVPTSANLLRVDTRPPIVATLTSPANLFDTNSTSIGFSWGAASDTGTGIASYRLQIDRLNTFSVLVVDSVTTLMSGVRTLAANDTYYWRVVVVDNSGNTTAYSSFRLRLDNTAPSIPTPSAPADTTDTASTSVSFSWTAPSDVGTGVSYYRLQVDTSPAFAAPLVDSSTTLLTASRTLPPNETYHWRVLAVDSAGNVSGGTARLLRVDTAPPTPVILSRYNGDTGIAPVWLNWSDAVDTVTAVRNYVVEVDTSGTFLVLSESKTLATGVTTYYSTLYSEDTFYWRVLAYDTVGNISISLTDSFRLRFGDTLPPSSFDLVAPADLLETSSTTLTFEWQASTDDTSPPVKYRLQADTSGSFTTNLVDTYWLADTAPITLTLSANEVYWWRVIARDNALCSTVSNSAYALIIDTAGPTATALVANAGAAVSSPTHLLWTASSDALSGLDKYVIQIDTSGLFTGPFIESSTLAATETGYWTGILGADTYFWRIIAYDALGNSTVSAPSADSFVMLYDDTVAPVFISATAFPSSVNNACTTSVLVAILAVDSVYVDTVLVHLSAIGQADSTLAIPGTLVPSTDSSWSLTIVFDTTLSEGVYDLTIAAFDAALNSSTTVVQVSVLDTSTSMVEIVDTPVENMRVAGNELSIVSTYGDDYVSVLYQFRTVTPISSWQTCTPAASTSNPDTSAPFWGFYWDISSLVDGAEYDVRAVGTDLSGNTDPNPSYLRITVDAVDSTVNEYRDATTNDHVRRQLVSPDTAAMELLADGTKLEIPKGGVSDTVWIRITVYDTAPTAAPAPTAYASAGFGSFREFVREDGLRLFPEAVTITLPYGDSDSLDDKVGATAYNEADLAIYYYDEAARIWIKVAGSVVDPVTNTVSASVTHFTQYAVFGIEPASNNLANVIVYPNPFIPYDNDDRNGTPYIAGVSGGIFFDNLTFRVTIEIYDVNGRLVATLGKNQDANRLHWDARSGDGRELASGMYIAVIKSSTGEKSVRKIMIVR